MVGCVMGKIQGHTLDRVNDKITFSGLRPTTLVILGVTVILGFIVLSSFFNLIIAAVPTLGIAVLARNYGKKVKERTSNGDYDYEKKMFEFKRSKKQIVDTYDIINKM